MSAGGLYTPEILGAAMELSNAPWDETLPCRGSARSRSCGSTIDLAMKVDADGAIVRLGIRPHACAVGQAAAAVFLRGSKGCNSEMIGRAREELALWLSEGGSLPDWPGIALLEPARAYPARHGAILLAWDAALDALAHQVRA